MATDFYISDTHFGHSNIIRLCNRPFVDVTEMDRVLIENWNARVGKDDHVWHLGDFSFKSAIPAENYLKKLNGIKHLIIGNHDAKGVLKQANLSEWFETVDYALFRTDGAGRKLWLCHYPMMSAPRNTYMLYGHIHSNQPESFWPLLSTYESALNCSVEVNGYMPVTLEELIVNNQSWRET